MEAFSRSAGVWSGPDRAFGLLEDLARVVWHGMWQVGCAVSVSVSDFRFPFWPSLHRTPGFVMCVWQVERRRRGRG